MLPPQWRCKPPDSRLRSWASADQHGGLSVRPTMGRGPQYAVSGKGLLSAQLSTSHADWAITQLSISHTVGCLPGWATAFAPTILCRGGGQNEHHSKS